MESAIYPALAVLLALSFYFSLTETAFTALSRIRIKNMADKGSKRAQLTLTLYDDYDRLLSTLLIGTNITNISVASICTMLFVNRLGDIGASLSVAFTTIIVLIFTEVTPKNLAKESPERIALLCAPLAKLFMLLFTPANAFFVVWRKGLLRLFKPAKVEKSITEDELLSFVQEAHHTGIIDDGDNELIRNVIEFYDQKAKNILTPRTDMVTISKDAPKEDIAHIFFSTGFSRIPVYDKSIDRIVGVIHTRHFLRYVMQDDVPFDSIISPALFVPSLMDIGDIFKLLQQQKSHMAIVIDEHGGTDGLITMEDIVEELMGEIWDENDNVVEHFISQEDGSHRVMCSADTHHFFRHFNLTTENCTTLPPSVSGWIMLHLGKIPEEGDTFSYANLVITISKTERRRTLECIVQLAY